MLNKFTVWETMFLIISTIRTDFDFGVEEKHLFYHHILFPQYTQYIDYINMVFCFNLIFVRMFPDMCIRN